MGAGGEQTFDQSCSKFVHNHSSFLFLCCKFKKQHSTFICSFIFTVYIIQKYRVPKVHSVQKAVFSHNHQLSASCQQKENKLIFRNQMCVRFRFHNKGFCFMLHNTADCEKTPSLGHFFFTLKKQNTVQHKRLLILQHVLKV